MSDGSKWRYIEECCATCRRFESLRSGTIGWCNREEIARAKKAEGWCAEYAKKEQEAA